jgi:hypothetical protein
MVFIGFWTVVICRLWRPWHGESLRQLAVKNLKGRQKKPVARLEWFQAAAPLRPVP